MRLRAAVAVGLAATSLQVYGDDYLDATLIGVSERVVAAAQGGNVDKLYLDSSWEHGLAAILNGRAAGISFKGRAQRSRIESATGEHRTDDDLRLLELATSRVWGERVMATVGKTFLNWDVGLSAQPLGFFQWENQLTDIGDSLSQAEGIPLLALAWLGDGFDITAAYGGGVDKNRDHVPEQAALNLGWRHDRVTWALVAQRPAAGRTGLGGTFSWTATPELVVHGSLFSRRGSARGIDRRLIDPDYPIGEFGPWRQKDRRHYLKSVLGATWSLSGNSSLVAEWSYDASGLDRRQWQLYRQTLARDIQQYRDAPEGTALFDLYTDAKALTTNGARQHYLFLQWRFSEGDWSFSPLLRAGEGGAVMAHLSASYRLTKASSANLALTSFQGRADSEYRQLPTRHIARVSLNWTF